MSLIAPTRLARHLTLLLIVILIPSCGTMTGSSVRTECETFKPIYWSSRDSFETVKQVKAHNAAWAALCMK